MVTDTADGSREVINDPGFRREENGGVLLTTTFRVLNNPLIHTKMVLRDFRYKWNFETGKQADPV